MPTLSVRVVRNPRRSRYCDNCHKRIIGEAIRLYGMAEYGDKPYQVFVHRECLTGRDEIAKLRAAELQRAAVTPDTQADYGWDGTTHYEQTMLAVDDDEQ